MAKAENCATTWHATQLKKHGVEMGGRGGGGDFPFNISSTLDISKN